jgi:hypothetical protein
LGLAILRKDSPFKKKHLTIDDCYWQVMPLDISAWVEKFFDGIYPHDNFKAWEQKKAALEKKLEPWFKAWYPIQQHVPYPASVNQLVYYDSTYREAANAFIRQQRREPIHIEHGWLYLDQLFGIANCACEIDVETGAALIKHHVLKQEKKLERVQRELKALENLEKLESPGNAREPIPDSVRLFVWQRDKGQCVKCESREKLEFDHIIPVVSGGSSTERNVQLLCEPCNRSSPSRNHGCPSPPHQIRTSGIAASGSCLR